MFFEKSRVFLAPGASSRERACFEAEMRRGSGSRGPPFETLELRNVPEMTARAPGYGSGRDLEGQDSPDPAPFPSSMRVRRARYQPMTFLIFALSLVSVSLGFMNLILAAIVLVGREHALGRLLRGRAFSGTAVSEPLRVFASVHIIENYGHSVFGLVSSHQGDCRPCLRGPGR